MSKKTIILFILSIVLTGCLTTDKHSSNDSKSFRNNKLAEPEIDMAMEIPVTTDQSPDMIDADGNETILIPLEDRQDQTKKTSNTQFTSKKKLKTEELYDLKIESESSKEKMTEFSKKNILIPDEKNVDDIVAYLQSEIESNSAKIQDLSISKNDLSKDIKEKRTENITEKIEDKIFDLTNLDSMRIMEHELKETEVDENSTVFISLESSGWVIKSIKPQLLDLAGRENTEKNTLFKFSTKSPSTVEIIFLRYDDKSNIMWRQPYKVTVLPVSFVNIKKENAQKKETTKNETDRKQVNKNVKDDRNKEIANQLYEQKDLEEAKKRYLSIISEGTADPEVFYKLGMIEKNGNDLAKAYEYFKSALGEKNSIFYLDSLKELIKILKYQKNFTEAIDTFFKFGFNQGISEGDAEDLYLLLADLYFGMKDYKSAAKEYRRFIERYPASKNYDKALFFLAYSVENYQIDPDFKEAYRIYKIIVDERPESNYYNLSRNRLLYLERHYLKIN
jgi:tetratricopeptide (TPR) repeat protein